MCFLIHHVGILKSWNLIGPGHTKNCTCQLFPNFSLDILVQLSILYSLMHMTCTERFPSFSELKIGQDICHLLVSYHFVEKMQLIFYL